MEYRSLEKVANKMAMDIVTKARVIEMPQCKFCGSTEVVKNGRRGGTQYWLCKDCGRGFVDNKGLPKGRYPMEAVSSALYMYFTGSSLNDIKRYIEHQFGTELPSDSAIYSWVTKFSEIASKEARKHKPAKLGDIWIADEMFLSIGGKRYYLWNVIDSKTRYLIASYLSPKRGTQEAKKLMELAAKLVGKVPKVVRTDSLASYIDGIELAFGADTKHIQSHPFAKEDSTNLIERWNATLRERTKVMWGMKKPETARTILDGFLVFYNYFRPHESLDGKTPAEVAGIDYPYRNWLDVIKSQSPAEQQEEKTDMTFEEELELIHHPKPYRKRLKPKKNKRKTQSKIQTIMGGIRQ